MACSKWLRVAWSHSLPLAGEGWAVRRVGEGLERCSPDEIRDRVIQGHPPRISSGLRLRMLGSSDAGLVDIRCARYPPYLLLSVGLVTRLESLPLPLVRVKSLLRCGAYTPSPDPPLKGRGQHVAWRVDIRCARWPPYIKLSGSPDAIRERSYLIYPRISSGLRLCSINLRRSALGALSEPAVAGAGQGAGRFAKMVKGYWPRYVRCASGFPPVCGAGCR